MSTRRVSPVLPNGCPRRRPADLRRLHDTLHVFTQMFVTISGWLVFFMQVSSRAAGAVGLEVRPASHVPTPGGGGRSPSACAWPPLAGQGVPWASTGGHTQPAGGQTRADERVRGARCGRHPFGTPLYRSGRSRRQGTSALPSQCASLGPWRRWHAWSTQPAAVPLSWVV